LKLRRNGVSEFAFCRLDLFRWLEDWGGVFGCGWSEGLGYGLLASATAATATAATAAGSAGGLAGR
jgi:hypothetical protein